MRRHDDPALPGARYVFPCSHCDAPAGAVTVFAPGAQLPERGDPDTSFLYEGRWAVEVEHHGRGVTRWPCDAHHAAVVKKALLRFDVAALRLVDGDLVTFVCRVCSLPYCVAHMPTVRVDEAGGHPAFDYYFAARCPLGHEFTFERS